MNDSKTANQSANAHIIHTLIVGLIPDILQSAMTLFRGFAHYFFDGKKSRDLDNSALVIKPVSPKTTVSIRLPSSGGNALSINHILFAIYCQTNCGLNSFRFYGNIRSLSTIVKPLPFESVRSPLTSALVIVDRRYYLTAALVTCECCVFII